MAQAPTVPRPWARRSRSTFLAPPSTALLTLPLAWSVQRLTFQVTSSGHIFNLHALGRTFPACLTFFEIGTRSEVPQVFLVIDSS